MSRGEATVPDTVATRTVNPGGRSPFVLICDHASNHLPERYGDMGLSAQVLESHVAWDPGALAISEALAAMLDAPLVASTVSRLVIDCNRALDAADLIWTLSEYTAIPANRNLPPEERAFRIEAVYAPFHAAIDALIDSRAGRETVLVCVHSFTPVYFGSPRPWPVGLIHGRDPRFTAAVHGALSAGAPGLDIGWNRPYAAIDGVTLTLERHGDARGLEATMIEIRNDEIADEAGVALWARRLADALADAHAAGTRQE
jgi:predicted N-formylglutamate amidohydrolase